MLLSFGFWGVLRDYAVDVVTQADLVIDLGPDGGNAGGRVVASAPPETVVKLGTTPERRCKVYWRGFKGEAYYQMDSC